VRAMQFKDAPRLSLQGKGKLGGLSIHLRVVDDVGRAVNPMIVHGQTHGGIAQGVGQALLEHSYYDPENGQLLAASFLYYAMPRADTFPALKTALSEMPAPSNRLGVRSGGEGDTTPAFAAVPTRSSTRSPSSACATSRCRRPLSECGARSASRAAAPPRVEQYFRRHRDRAVIWTYPRSVPHPSVP
jgi:Molybdopterin-binding domain of aldehyde dehydrogenase